MSDQVLPNENFEVPSDLEAFEQEFSQLSPEELTDIRPLPRVSMHAFCESPQLLSTIESVANDRRMARVHVKAVSGGIRAATEFFSEAPTPNLILLEANMAYEELLEDLDRLAEVCDVGTKVVLVGHINDVQMYRDLVRRGVSEYIVMPVGQIELIQALSDLFSNPENDPLGKSIAFIGAKGGVGSSTMAHNIGWAISTVHQQDVIITDFDVAFGTAGLDFNEDPPQTIADAIKAADRLDDQFLERLLTKCSERLNLLTAPAVLDQTCDYDDEFFSHMLELLQNSAPYTVLDLPHLWSAWNKHLLLGADEIVITVAPDLANLRNVKNLLDLIGQERRGDREPFLIINQTGMQKRPEIKAKDFVAALERTDFIEVPFDPATFGLAANNGQMISELSASGKIADIFDKLASDLTGRTEAPKASKSLFAPLLGKLKKSK
ncbi:pilus assembly protein CpaE [Cohaesibacter sp. ES.047]|uniref:AAA family ATPase n=1 Tax=Cohaesibacter sp. ES.047 TaxID=1798205 RepID=UPI000BB92A89|nr:AAA family ATPase [Cohaesibacter sp. ES.047]SNY91825.1 pilus assembly protein CpaE [Cohaesibacter sp. ES.047]